MKKLFILAAAMLFAVTSVFALTPEEKAASDARIVILKAPAPKACGIQQIDDLAAKCKTIADATVGIAAITGALNGGTADEAAYNDLKSKIEAVGKQLAEVGGMMGNALSSLKELKNPLKAKPAKNSIDYAHAVVKAAGEEIAYQGKVLAAMVKK